MPFHRFAAAIAVSLVFVVSALPGQELPKPSIYNTVIVSFEHNPADADEVDYIKANFPFGLYALLSFSITHVAPNLAWDSNWSQAEAGIAAFKAAVDGHIEAAKARGVKLHLVVCSGLARNLGIYAAAKTEDIRNAQWFNDGNLGTAAQVAAPSAMTDHIFGTLSRYARKLRANLEAKAQAAFAFLKQRMDEYPDTLIAVSGWGEAELSWKRIDNLASVQDWFCDYSPFAVLEFRDWITHEGLYADDGIYGGWGWEFGGEKYRGAAGLSQFNADFGTAFTTWQLEYFDWSLSDHWPADPNRIPFSAYVHDGMRPADRTIAGGFDPPRVMQPGEIFWDLWNLFREAMVNNFVRDAARWASNAGIPPQKWFSHQIPADYLFGTTPASPPLNARYYTSASPLWTADIGSWGSVGATVYDIKFPDRFARTTEYVLPDLASMAEIWAVMEYDPETYPAGMNVPESSVDFLLEEYLKVYRYGPALINFWRWWDTTGEHRIKGLNKEEALRQFVGLIRDRAKSPDLTVVYDPPRVTGANAVFQDGGTKAGIVIPSRIWADASHVWTDWGDFDHFEVFRYVAAGQPEAQGELLVQTTDYRIDGLEAGIPIPAMRPRTIPYYFRVRAVNSKGVAGPLSVPFKAQ